MAATVTFRVRQSKVAPTRTRSATDNPLKDAVKRSHDDNQPLEFDVVHAGVSAVKRDGTATGVDRNVQDAINLLRRAANDLNIGVSVEHVPGEKPDTSVVRFLGKARTKRERKAKSTDAVPQPAPTRKTA